jgi:NAD(P)-dependent dehydrogenase (short-subunit alcohol dehydrogenase family)
LIANPKLDPSLVTLPPHTTVCITGGGRGLGESIALGFAKAGAGGIIICSRSKDELDEVAAKILRINKKIKVTAVKCDVTNEDEVIALTERIKKEHGRLRLVSTS